MEQSRFVEIALKVVHFLHPSIITLLYLALLCHKPLQRTDVPKGSVLQRRGIALCLTFFLVLSYASEEMVCLYRFATQKGWWPSLHSIFHITGSWLIWFAFNLHLLDVSEPSWDQYCRCWALNCLFETMLCILEAVSISRSEGSRYNVIVLTLQVLRVVCSISLGLLARFQMNIRAQNDEESQPLLANESTEQTVYGTTPTDVTENGNDGSVIRERQRKRLEEQGWLVYIKGFHIFLPYLWPTKSTKGKLCSLVLIFDLLINRFLRIWTPRQFGVITDTLIARDFDRACYEIGLWVFCIWLKSPAGPLGFIKQSALMEGQNFSYREVCRAAFQHVMGLSMDFHSNKDSSEIVKAVEQGNAINNLAELLLLDILPIIFDFLFAMYYIKSLFDGYMAFVTIIVGFSYVCISVKLTNWTQLRRKTYKDASRTESNIVNESLRNWQTIMYFNQIEREKHQYERAVEDSLDAKRAYKNRMNLGTTVETLIMFLGLLGASFLAVRKLSIVEASAGNFITLTTLWEAVMYPLEMIIWSYSIISSIGIDVGRLLELFSEKPSVSDRPDSHELEVYGSEVEFRNVEFSHSPGGKKILDRISFKAAPGEKIAITGRTGSGKSTMFNLLYRSHDVTGGSILIDGQDIRNVSLESLRKALGIVPQDPHFFNTSVLENVRYARSEATEKDIHDACKRAAIHSDIESLEDGYNTQVGEGGVKLSGGQRQLLAFARLGVKNPKIVILDEPTSALDSLTEAQVQEGFQFLGQTTFVVAHRLPTIKDADLILFLKDGKIVERGKHQELLGKKGEYFKLWKEQNG